ncbi:O-antigen ligase family protein [Mycobacterium sp. ZZG]
MSIHSSAKLGARLASPSTRSRDKILGALFILSSLALSLHFFQGAVANAILLALAVVIVAAKVSTSKAVLLGHDWMYLLYFSVAVLSLTWSVSPEESLLQALPMIVPWIITFLLHDLDEVWACRFIVFTAAAAALLSLAMVSLSGRLAYQPVSSSGAPELRGIFAHQLFLGTFLTIALGLIAIACLNGDGRKVLGSSRVFIVLLVFGFIVVLFFSRTRLYVAAGVLAFLLTWSFSRSNSRRWLALNMVGLAVLVTFLSVNKALQYLADNEFDLTLTGRTDVWARTLNALGDGMNAWGFGLGSFQLPMFDHLFGNYRPSHANNSFLQAYFELGAVGLTVLIVMVLVQLVGAFRYSLDSRKYSYSLFMVLFSIFGSLTGGGIYAGFLTTPLCVMLLFLSIETRKLRLVTR